MHPTPGPPPLRPWSRAWRYLVAGSVGLGIWLVASMDLISTVERAHGVGELPADVAGPVVAAVLLDLVLGVVAVALLPLRRRHPVAVACTTAALTSVSTAAVGGAALAAVSMSTWRRWRWVAVTGVAWALATAGYEGAFRQALPVPDPPVALTLAGVLLAVAAFAAWVATGFYVGARRELFSSLQERLATAEREQALRADAARQAERTRIAREMHDVLAHRISLVAMHAGALSYRTDLSRTETAQAAGVIQENAHRALTELREVLGVLRTDDDGHGSDGHARSGLEDHVGVGPHDHASATEPPQPTLAHLPGLLADATAAGTEVTLVDELPSGSAPSVTVSRTAFRTVQECLTNARKHAPACPVRVELSGSPDEGLRVRVSNPLPTGPVGDAPTSGLGLTGLAERTSLAGGRLTHGTRADGAFVVEAWLPWEPR